MRDRKPPSVAAGWKAGCEEGCEAGCPPGCGTTGCGAGARCGAGIAAALACTSESVGAGCEGVIAFTAASWRSRFWSASAPGALGSSGRSTSS